MARQKKPVHRVQMTEGKRNIIHQLLEEYLNKAISALVKKDAGQKANGTSGTTGANGTSGKSGKAGSTSNTNNGKAAKTGDPSGLFGWLGLVVTSLGAGIGGVSLKRKKREDEEA